MPVSEYHEAMRCRHLPCLVISWYQKMVILVMSSWCYQALVVGHVLWAWLPCPQVSTHAYKTSKQLYSGEFLCLKCFSCAFLHSTRCVNHRGPCESWFGETTLKGGLVRHSDLRVSHTKPFSQVYWGPKVASWKATPLSGVFWKRKETSR